MAIQIMTDVWEHSRASGTELLVLLAIADAADRQSRTAYSGLERLAHYARVSPRQALRHLKSLIESGELERTSAGRIGQRAGFRVLVGEGVSHDTLEGDIQDTLEGDIQRQKRVSSSVKRGCHSCDTPSNYEPTTDPKEDDERRIIVVAEESSSLTAEGRDAFQALLPRIRNATAFTAELRMIVAGARNVQPQPSWEAVSLALVDLVTADVAEPTPNVLRAFVRKAAEALRGNGQRPETPQENLARYKAKLLAEEEAKHCAATH